MKTTGSAGLRKFFGQLIFAFASLACSTLPALAAVGIGEDYDVLNLPAKQSPLASKTWLHAITRAGDRLVAVGHRGHIIYSDDGGRTWTQAAVPVRSDLTAVDFPSPKEGWAAGHEGVILRSTDGGETWTKVLDGYQFNEMSLKHYQQLAQENPEDPLYPILVEEAQFALEQGADRPWYVIHVNQRGEVYAAGAYGLLAVSYDKKTWVPILEGVENHDGFNHIFGYARFGEDDFMLVGERGSVWYQPQPNQPWKRLSPFYTGSLYTAVIADDGAVIVSGMRGSTFRSTDKGFTWKEVEMPVAESIIGSERLEDGRLVLVSAAGSILVSDDQGLSFQPVKDETRWPYTDLIEVEPGVILLTGRNGVRRLELPHPTR